MKNNQTCSPVPEIHLIVTCDRGNAIGTKGMLPWIPGGFYADMEWVESLTRGKVVVAGQSTLEKYGKRYAPDGRMVIPLSKSAECNQSPSRESYTFNEFANTFFYCKDAAFNGETVDQYKKDVFYVLGGETIFKLFLPYASVIHMMRIDHVFANTTQHFPRMSFCDWDSRKVSQPARSNAGFAYRTMEFRRQNGRKQLPQALLFTEDAHIDPWASDLTEKEKELVIDACRKDSSFMYHLARRRDIL